MQRYRSLFLTRSYLGPILDETTPQDEFSYGSVAGPGPPRLSLAPRITYNQPKSPTKVITNADNHFRFAQNLRQGMPLNHPPSTTQPPRLESSRYEPLHLEPSRLAPPRLNPSRLESSRYESARLGPLRFDPSRFEPPRLDPHHVEDIMDNLSDSIPWQGAAPQFGSARSTVQLESGNRQAGSMPAPRQDFESALRSEFRREANPSSFLLGRATNNISQLQRQRQHITSPFNISKSWRRVFCAMSFRYLVRN